MANQDFLEAGDMRQELCAEFSLPPEGQHNCKFEEHELPAQPFTMDRKCML